MQKYVMIVALLAAPTLAYADAIDGAWCNKAGQHLSISGPELTLNDYSKLQGAHRRHEFLYTVPAGGADAGDQIYLRLLNEDQMASYHIKGDEAVDPIGWDRCALPPKTS
ncbi:MAG: hypothetical protein KGO94_00090 [Alphaproteobacteria bacterium]|nr:hypothetical protein [Alphaproteobacteria bacterium]